LGSFDEHFGTLASWCIVEEEVQHQSCQYKENEKSYHGFLCAELGIVNIVPLFKTFKSNLSVIVGHDNPIKQN